MAGDNYLMYLFFIAPEGQYYYYELIFFTSHFPNFYACSKHTLTHFFIPSSIYTHRTLKIPKCHVLLTKKGVNQETGISDHSSGRNK